MARMVMLQFCVAFIVAIIAALIRDQAAGISALSGGLCYAIPNALFALRLHAEEMRAAGQKSRGVNPFTFFVGEFLKIVATIALLATVVWLYRDLNWLAFLIGFIAVLKVYVIFAFRLTT